MKEAEINALFTLSETLFSDYLSRFVYPWEALPGIGEEVERVGKALAGELYEELGEHVYIAKSAVVAPSAVIIGPVIIGERSEVRPGAYIRGKVLVGADCVVGNSTELKNVILFNHVQVPHYNYVGDSILGFHAHMGAGSITSNVKADRRNIVVKSPEESIETGLRKFGAMLGDYAEIGCNAVLNPGTVIGKRTSVYPVSSVRGVIPADSIYKSPDEIIVRKAIP